MSSGFVQEDIYTAHNAAAAGLTHGHRLVCAIIVIDGRVTARCSSPACQLYTSGNEIHVLHAKRNFVCVGQGVTHFTDWRIPAV